MTDTQDRSGGNGALRDAVEFILKAQGKWKQAVEDYISERNPKKNSAREQ